MGWFALIWLHTVHPYVLAVPRAGAENEEPLIDLESLQFETATEGEDAFLCSASMHLFCVCLGVSLARQ